MGSALKRILNRLHSVFEKDPQRTASVFLSAPEGTTIKISDRKISLLLNGTKTEIDANPTASSVGGVQDIQGYFLVDGDGDVLSDTSTATIETVQDVVTFINSMAGYTATLLQPDHENFLAMGISDDEEHSISEDFHLYYPTNPLWAELHPVAWMLEEQEQRLRTAEDQLYIDRSAGEWLDLWGKKYFKVPRLSGETDTEYAQRIIFETIRPNQNNVALELILQDAIGVSATIIDAWPVRAELAPEDQPRSPGHFLLEMGIPNELDTTQAQALIDKCYAVVRRHKAGGTDFMNTVLRKIVNQVEIVAGSETFAVSIIVTLSETLLPGAIQVGAGWRVGTPGLVVGENESLKEQLFVQKIVNTGGAVESSDLYGG